MILGAHLSTAGGLWTVFDRADQARADAIQVFTKNKGMWAARPLGDEEVRLFRTGSESKPPRPLFAHAAYLINVASPVEAIRRRSIDALRVEVERCELLGIPHLVLHPGCHMGTGESKGARLAAAGVDEVARSTRGFRTRILLEIASGQGSAICATIPTLAALLDRVREPERFAACLDTCHLFAAGYDLRSEEGYASTLAEIESRIGLERVLCIHANDSKRELGSRVDRHEHIGRGLLGKDAFRRLVNDPRLAAIPLVLELPPEDDMNRINLRTLRGLVRRSKTRRAGARSR